MDSYGDIRVALMHMLSRRKGGGMRIVIIALAFVVCAAPAMCAGLSKTIDATGYDLSALERLLHGLGAAVVRVLPAIAVVPIAAIFARKLWAFLLAGTLPTLVLPFTALIIWWRLGVVTGTARDHPAQQAFDIVLSLIAGALVGYAAFALIRRFRPSGAVIVGTAILGTIACALLFRGEVYASEQFLHCDSADKGTLYIMRSGRPR